jgi:hypothetical protein
MDDNDADDDDDGDEANPYGLLYAELLITDIGTDWVTVAMRSGDVGVL